jgi:hypothetical protein
VSSTAAQASSTVNIPFARLLGSQNAVLTLATSNLRYIVETIVNAP